METGSSSLSGDQICLRFSLSEIQSATQNFHEALVIGRGGFGKVYKGPIITNGSNTTVAIKRLDSMSNQGAPQFRAEVEMLSKLRHSHLVSLIGYCNERIEMVLVYEYMPHGTLKDRLHKVGPPLSWLQRLKICVGAARGLDYLHTGTGTRHGVIHRDVKSSNILLDENFAAKISNFGLAKIGPTNQTRTYVSTRVKGTLGYLDPYYFNTGKLTHKSDVYSFGVVLLEVLCGRPAMDTSLDEEQWGLALWAQDRIKEGKVSQIIDPRLKGQISSNCLKDFASIACNCLHDLPNKRPTMVEIVARLELVLSLQETNLYYKQAMETGSSPLSRDQLCLRFSLFEIKTATQNFDESMVIGRGGFGKVYKGPIITNGSNTTVAIKRLHSMSNQGAPEFKAEVEMLSMLRHCNLVSLIGYCTDITEMVLVYEYMPHGTLEDHLHKVGPPLSWLQRLKICVGAARGLDYLHNGTGTQHGVIHRDVKSSNILLDDNFAAKISDFGLAKIGPTNQTRTYVSTGVKGTFGYMDPTYFYTGKLTRKSDVYSFGVVLLEVLCGRPAVDTCLDEEHWGLVPWAQDRIKEGKLGQIIDPRLKGQISSNCLKEFARTAVSCLHNYPNKRPTMAEIVVKLEVIHSLQERTDLSAPEGNFIEKLRSFFAPKFPLKLRNSMPTHTRSEGEPGDRIHDKLVNAPVAKEEAKADVGKIIHFSDASSFDLEDMMRASAEVISKSIFWTSYRAVMEDGNQLMVICFKRGLSWRDDDVLERVCVLSKISHTNILAPTAYYHSEDATFYITDYIQNGSVASLLHSSDHSGPKAAINWSTRKKIIVGITRGLAHLHSKENIVHGYLKSSNVLLDKNYSPLLADVGFSQLPFDAIPHTPHHYNHAPELLEFQKANMSTDVYSLGLIILELLTRKSTQSTIDGFDSAKRVGGVAREEWTAEIFDVQLITESNIEEELVRMLELAMACVSFVPDERPTAHQLLQKLASKFFHVTSYCW